jgi:hypothetical protein
MPAASPPVNVRLMNIPLSAAPEDDPDKEVYLGGWPRIARHSLVKSDGT